MDASNLSPLILCAFGVTVMGFVSRLYFGAQDAREHMTTLTARWRTYSSRRGDEVWKPSRWAFLQFGGAPVYARMHGVRNFLPFEAQISEVVQEDSRPRQTLFVSTPTWLPDGATLQIQPGSAPAPSGLELALVAHELAVYARPSDLVAALSSDEGERLLDDFANLPAGASLQAARDDSYKQYFMPPASASLRVPSWCVDEQDLDSCIDVLTRFCRLLRRQ